MYRRVRYSDNFSSCYLLMTCHNILSMADVVCMPMIASVVISGDGWFYDFGDSNRAFKRDCTVYTGY